MKKFGVAAIYIWLCLVLNGVGCAEKEKESESSGGEEEVAACDSDCQTEWLSLHNGARQALNAGNLQNSPQPSVAVGDLIWDEDLAEVAQSHAETCTYDANADRTTEYQALSGVSEFVGENRAMEMVGASPVNIDRGTLFQLWMDEEPDFVYGTFSLATHSSVQRYLQVIWHSTTKVGCGEATCEDSGLYTNYVVCNYAPAGLVSGAVPYFD